MAIHKLSSLVVGFLLLIHGIHSIPTPDGKSVSIPIPPSNMGTTIYQLPANFDYSPYMKSSKLNSRAARDSFVTVPLSVITQSSVMTITPGKNHKLSQICQTRETSGTVVDAQTLMRQFSNRGSDLCCQTNGAQPMHHLTHYNTSIVPFYNHTKGFKERLGLIQST
ncbi:hypothetical protein FPQ18DRAFT_310462 [Pyronema domesticum]|nr:hypothetical protein FPQ18DRAFT_310462 [Pyronema domesticum]